MRMNTDLSTQEEYARSEHTAADSNKNAKGYVESTPAMSAPGGLAMSGYMDCHMQARPYRIECLGHAVAEGDGGGAINELFVVDVLELKVGGKLRALLLTAVAHLIGSYN
jgi:hypothetical protein